MKYGKDLNARLAWIVSMASASSAWMKTHGFDLSIELVTAMIRERLAADRPGNGATPRQRILRMATILREVADQILEIVKDIPQPTEEPSP